MDRIEYRSVIKFLTKEGTSPSEIHKRLQAVYGTDAPSFSTVKAWARQFRFGKETVADEPRTGRPADATSDEIVERVSDLIAENDRLTKNQLAEMLNISPGSALRILRDSLGMVKVGGRWVSSTREAAKASDSD
ncbi:protein GVQW3-like [Lutzomyia longipalpis]|nr:protein GVQW3-like [Lutzomyia longipalpis]